jgi:hypothetical protein
VIESIRKEHAVEHNVRSRTCLQRPVAPLFMPSYQASLLAHYRAHWLILPTALRSTRPSVRHLAAMFHVLEFPPSAHRAMWIYATCGMSSWHMDQPLELHLFAANQARPRGLADCCRPLSSNGPRAGLGPHCQLWRALAARLLVFVWVALASLFGRANPRNATRRAATSELLLVNTDHVSRARLQTSGRTRGLGRAI